MTAPGIVGANIVARMTGGARHLPGAVEHGNPELATLMRDARAESRRRGQELRNRQLLIAGAVLLVGILLAAFEGIRIARPLRALAAQAGAVAAGDFERRVDARGRDEVGQVAASFNSMAHSLGDLLRKMAEKASLERELAARSIQELMSPPPSLHARALPVAGTAAWPPSVAATGGAIARWAAIDRCWSSATPPATACRRR
jgi:HAMP domain-containing protein